MIEIDDASAATTARKIAEEKRIIWLGGYDIGSDDSEGNNGKTAGFYVLDIDTSSKCPRRSPEILAWLCRIIFAMPTDCQARSFGHLAWSNLSPYADEC